jgi:hypothetical protein
MPTLARLVRCSLLAAASLASVACSSSSPPAGGEHLETTGAVQAALSAVGSDGATYSIPSTASLLYGNASGFECALLAATPTETFSLPVGTYTFYLNASGSCSQPADAGTNVPFTLTRAGDGGATTVSAVLLNPVQTVTVTQGNSATLVFQFALEQLGTITMSTGNVTIGVSTGSGTTTVAATTGTLTETVPSGTWVPGASPIAALSTLLASTTAGSATVGISHLGAFTPNNFDQVCAPFTPTVASSGLSTGYAALFQETGAAGATGTLCINDANNVVPNIVSATVTRTGTPVTSAMQAALTPDGGAVPSASFTLDFQGHLPMTVDTGTQLNLALLSTPAALTLCGNAIYVLPAGASGYAGYAQINAGVTGSLTLAP